MSLRQAHKAAGWIDPSHRILPLVGVLILSVFAFIFVSREAQAQQQPTAASDKGALESVTESASVETSLIKTPPVKAANKTSHVD